MQSGTVSLLSFSKKYNKVALQPSEFTKTTYVQKLQTCIYPQEELLAALILNLYTCAPHTNSLCAGSNLEQPAAPPAGVYMFVAAVHVCHRLV